MAKILAPVSMKDPIVDLKTGNVTPYFQRLLQDISDARIAASLADALGGDPGADMIVIWDDTLNTFSFKTVSETLDWLGSEAQGDVLYRGFDGWVLLPAGTDGDVLTTHGAAANPTWETPSAGGGGTWALQGTGQTATGIWDQAVDGSKATVDFAGLSGTEILIHCRLVTQASSGVLALRASTDNGSTYRATSGDYVSIATNGVESNSDHWGDFHQTSATAARSGAIYLPAAGLNGVFKVSDCFTALLSNADRFFIQSTSPVNAVRIYSTGGGNLTGGKIYCLTR